MVVVVVLLLVFSFVLRGEANHLLAALVSPNTYKLFLKRSFVEAWFTVSTDLGVITFLLFHNFS